MLRYLYLICLLFVLGLSFSSASVPAKVAKPKLILHNDTAKVQVRVFDQTALKNYKKQPEFKYDDNYKTESLWSRFWHWFWNWLGDFFSKGKKASIIATFFEYLLVVLGIGALIFLIMRLAGVDPLNIFRRSPASANIPYAESLENIHEINFDADIEKAVAQQNYRFAVRLLYLRCLKQLNDAGRISWEINKTNSTYVNELVNPAQRLAFNLLTRQFEYIWYGEFIIDGQVFKKVNTLFHDFKVAA